MSENRLPDYLKDTALSLSYFEKQLKTFSVFQILTSTFSAPEVVDDGALYKFTFYLLTYLLLSGEENGKVIRNPCADLDHHQKSITSKGSRLARACQVLLTSVSAFVSYPV